MAIALLRGEETLAVNFCTFDSERSVAGKGGSPKFNQHHSGTRQALREGRRVPSMPSEETSLKETIKHLEEAARRIRTSRCPLQKNAFGEDQDYLRHVAQLSGALDVREAALRLRGAG